METDILQLRTKAEPRPSMERVAPLGGLSISVNQTPTIAFNETKTVQER